MSKTPSWNLGNIIQNLFYRSVSNQPLALFRILTGLWFFIDYFIEIGAGWVHDEYIAPPFHFTFIGFDWVIPWPGWGMYTLFIVTALAGLGIMLGYRYRLSVVVFLIGHLNVFFIDIVYNLNKSYLFILLAFMLLLMDAHSCWSLDAKKNPKIRKSSAPRWNLLVFQLMVGIIYTYSGISKLTSDWLIYRQPMTRFLSNNYLFGELNDQLLDMVISIFTYGGVAFDLSIIWLLFSKRTNFMANILQATFHLTNLITLGIGTLSIYMITITCLLFPTKWFRKRITYDATSETNTSSKPRYQAATTLFLVFFIIVQLLIPHRHYLTGNNVNWTEKGHRFSWRLMTRTKTGSKSSFTIIDNDSGERWLIDPSEYLTGRQYRKMSAETDLVLCFSKYLKELWEEKGHENIAIYSNILTRLNMRDPQHLIPPSLDLTKVERTFLVDEVSTQLAPRE